MRAFLKDGKTFVTKSSNIVLDYNLKKSIYDVVSEIRITTPNDTPQAGDLLFVDELAFLGVVKTVEIDEEATILKLNQIVTLLNRDLVFAEKSYLYLEDFVKVLIDENFTNCNDTTYALPYLEVNALTHTAKSINPDVEDNVYTIKSYLSKLRRLENIFCDWEISREVLTLNLVKKQTSRKNIDFSNPAFKITEEQYSEKCVSKITSVCEENSELKDWYLLKNGNVTSERPDSNVRKKGDWIVLNVSKAEDVENDVRDEFLKNTYSHSIEFSAPTNSGFELYDRVRVSINNEIFDSYVTTVEFSKNSEIMVVSLGELQTTYPYLALL